MSDPESELVAVVEQSSVAALLVRIPSTAILAASEAAGELAGVDAAALVGEVFEELTADDPPGAIELLRNGRITGYETERTFKSRDGSTGRRVKAWVRVVDQPPPVEFALGVLWPAAALADGQMPLPSADGPQAVFGTISPELLIERISEDVSGFGLASIFRDLVVAAT